MVRELSTAISDTVVVLSALNASWHLIGEETAAAIGFLIIGGAASLGVLRFIQHNPPQTLIGWHKYMAWISACLGLPLISLSYLRSAGYIWFANGHLAACAAVLMLQKVLSSEVTKPCGDILGGAAVVSILVSSLKPFNAHGFIGAVSYMVASLVVGTEGQMIGLQRVDIFHYLLAVGNIAMMMGLGHSAEPGIYYKPKP